MAAKSPEARRVLRELDNELADASSRQGRNLVWSAQEATIWGQIASLLDRKAEFSSLYGDAADTKTKLKISAELRLIEQAVARLVRLVKTDLAQPESMTTVKARRGALDNIADVFSRFPDCGVIAGRIDPKFIEAPPPWTLECQHSFNGWSLFNPDTYDFLRSDFQEVPSAAGPMMAIRKIAYDRAGGFPPDTIGVESNKELKSFNKLYVGPGDFGLCLKVHEAGFKVYYSSAIAVFHVIPPLRFTVAFWRSRMIGEGYAQAITARAFFGLKGLAAYAAWLRWQVNFLRFERKVVARLARAQDMPAQQDSNRAYPDELWMLFYKAKLDMDYVLRRHPGLCAFLWEIADHGVSGESHDHVIGKLPKEYKDLVSGDFVFDATPLDSLPAYQRLVNERGYRRKNFSLLFKHGPARAMSIVLAETILKLRYLFGA